MTIRLRPGRVGMIDEDEERKGPLGDTPDPYGSDDEVEEFEYEAADTDNESEYNPFAEFAAGEPSGPDNTENSVGDVKAETEAGPAGSSGEPEPTAPEEEPESGDMENPFTEGTDFEGNETGSVEPPSVDSGSAPKAEPGTEAGGAQEESVPLGTAAAGGENDVLSFEEHRKMSAADAENDKHRAKPKKLNKRFLLTAIVSVFCLSIVLTFLVPAKKKKSSAEDENVAKQGRLMDYSLYADRRENEDDASISGHYNDGNESESSRSKKDRKNDEDVKIPPVIPEEEKHPPYDPNRAQYSNSVQPKGGGGSGGLQIPDTRNDRLQGKSIAGIKGLTPTQQRYSTDYDEQIEANVASTARAQSHDGQMPSREEYLGNALAAYGSATAGANAYAMQNDQKGKNAFFNGGNRRDAGTGRWLGLNTIWEGTIFEATLTSAINTDLPGEITARVAKNIYSSQDARFLLIPQNSVLLGTYNSSISYAQSRVQVQWNTLIRPDGYRIELGGMNGTDPRGASGIKGHINDHPLAYLKAIMLMSSVSIMNGELTNQLGNTQNQYVQNVLADTQKVANELGEKLIDRAMNVQPTITIKEGTKINIVVNNTLSLPPCEQVPVTQKYMRNKK